MTKPRFILCLCMALVCLGPIASPALASDWKPVDPAELASMTPKVEKDSDAEALFWEVRVGDEMEGNLPRTVFQHYLRIKIFTERGREAQSKIDIPYLSSWSINDIAARTHESRTLRSEDSTEFRVQ